MAFSNFKSEAELLNMSFQELNQRRKDINVTLSQLRGARKRGYSPVGRVYPKLKAEKKLIFKIMVERGWQPV